MSLMTSSALAPPFNAASASSPFETAISTATAGFFAFSSDQFKETIIAKTINEDNKTFIKTFIDKFQIKNK
ncbi:MAG: hypothetical protein J0649_07530 [Methylococcales bacterium]|nr:hypothetical protein [Methylococcales bacterium]